MFKMTFVLRLETEKTVTVAGLTFLKQKSSITAGIQKQDHFDLSSQNFTLVEDSYFPNPNLRGGKIYNILIQIQESTFRR